MQRSTPRPRHHLPALVALLALAVPGLAMPAPPAPAKQQTSAALPAAKPDAKQRRASKAKRPPADSAAQPYQQLVDNVRDSSDDFRDDNVSENEERDRLPTPP